MELLYRRRNGTVVATDLSCIPIPLQRPYASPARRKEEGGEGVFTIWEDGGMFDRHARIHSSLTAPVA